MRLVEVGLRLAEGRRVGRRSAEVGREVVSEVSIGRQGSPERSSEVVRGRQGSPERSPEVVIGCHRSSARSLHGSREVSRGHQ